MQRASEAKKKVARMEEPEHICHGHLGKDKGWAKPIVVTRCDKDARPGYNTCKAHEYEEDADVLKEKVRLLAELIRRAKRCTAYTGAGISTASGINDYASKGDSKALKRPVLKSRMDAQPTLAHHVLTSMYKEGHLHHWVQQNHDGLPQKAGFPQHELNEIHGAWFDPSNPVVKMSGELRTDLFEWMESEMEKTDLCLAMGTSLCGMTSDGVADACASRAARGTSLGTVIVSLQRTQMDGKASLRFFCTIDRMMGLLAKELGLKPSINYKYYYPHSKEVYWGIQCQLTGRMPIVSTAYRKKGDGKEDRYISAAGYSSLSDGEKKLYEVAKPTSNYSLRNVFAVPYDENGRLLNKKKRNPKNMQVLKLQEGTKIRMTYGPFKGDRGKIFAVKKNKIRVALKHDMNKKYRHGQKKRAESARRLGMWMVEAAVEGRLQHLPFVTEEQ